MREKIIAIMEEICPGVDVANQTKLVDDEILDSIGIVRLTDAIETDFNVIITYVDLSPENLNSVDAIQRLVERLSK